MLSYSPRTIRFQSGIQELHPLFNHTTEYSDHYSRTTNDNNTKPTYQTLLFDRYFIICGKDKAGQSAPGESPAGVSSPIFRTFWPFLSKSASGRTAQGAAEFLYDIAL